MTGLVKDSDQTFQERFTYSPYGQRTVLDNTFAAKSNNATTVEWWLGRNGLRLDAETGNYYTRARNYLPSSGVFNGRDPLGYTDGANSYEYVRSHPINYGDPYGLQAATTQPSDPDDRGKDPSKYPLPPKSDPNRDKLDAASDCNCQQYALNKPNYQNSGRPSVGPAERNAKNPDGSPKYPNGITLEMYEQDPAVFADVLTYWFADPNSGVQGYPSDKDTPPPPGWHKIAAYSRSNDFHYATCNADGKWYDKVSTSWGMNSSPDHVWQDPTQLPGFAGFWDINTPPRTVP